MADAAVVDRPLLTVTDASVTYKRRGSEPLVAVDRVSFELASGQILGIVGESGCGKSTLARAICGLQRLSGGEILFGEHPVRPLGRAARPSALRAIQMVFQNPYASLNPRRRVGDQLRDALRIGSVEMTVEELLERVQLDGSDADKFPHQFSGGQRQRIAIARAIGAHPTILIGDEPIASLDASLQLRLATLMRDLVKQVGASMIFISHDLSIVRLVTDTIAVMKSGRIVETGSAKEIWNSPQHPYTKRLLAAIPIADGAGRIPTVDP